ncbi:hypothetical protein A2G96_01275 [Cupriavidus nantongensis]|uniref:Uncharacterized protein n=1 Tax=Cupriavidus nantongensis TaxID=1796606 RepID=A0A142JEH0_9BURK|nr:hypothetical protein A2G96_01275 [Cupriavidus nantongensis]
MPVIGGEFALFLEFGELLGFPSGAALGENAFQQLGACFGGSGELALCFAPRGSERTFNGCLEQGLAVLPQLLLSSLQLCYADVEFRQQFFELGDDAGLLRHRGEAHSQSPNFGEIDTRPRRAFGLLFELIYNVIRIDLMAKKAHISPAMGYASSNNICDKHTRRDVGRC